MLTIWGRINSHNVKKVVWLAEEMGLAYDRRDVGAHALGILQRRTALPSAQSQPSLPRRCAKPI